MSDTAEMWVVADSRDGSHIGHACYSSAFTAQAQINGWVLRDGNGGRPDIHYLIPFMVPLKVEER